MKDGASDPIDAAAERRLSAHLRPHTLEPLQATIRTPSATPGFSEVGMLERSLPRENRAMASVAAPTLRMLAVVSVLILALTAALVSTMVVAQQTRRATEADLQRLSTSIARSVDLKLRTYKAALQTVAQSHALRVDFDLDKIAADARRIGNLFGGGFVVATGGDTLEVLMSTAREDGSLSPPEPRSNDPELMRAEAETLRSGREVVSDAFLGRMKGEELVVSVPSAIDRKDSPLAFVYFSVTPRDITVWLEYPSWSSGF